MALAAMLPFLIQGGIGVASKLFGSKSSAWRGEKPSMKKFETLNHEQKLNLHDLLRHPDRLGMDLNKNPMFQQGQEFNQKLLSQDPEMMKQFEAPYMRQFNEQTVPGIAERFSGLGAQNSSAFGQTMGSAAAGLSERLAQLRGQLGMQASQNALQYAQAPGMMNLQRLNLGLGTQPFGYQQMPGSEGFGQGIQRGAMSGAGQSFGNFINGAASPYSGYGWGG